jgi:hypothetical protein
MLRGLNGHYFGSKCASTSSDNASTCQSAPSTQCPAVTTLPSAHMRRGPHWVGLSIPETNAISEAALSGWISCRLKQTMQDIMEVSGLLVTLVALR